MLKISGLDVVRISKNGKKAIRVMRNGKELWSDRISMPNGYTLLEYIQSSGSQFINTGFNPNQNTRVVMDVKMTSSGNSQFLFGTRTASATSNFSFLIASASFRSDYGESKINLSSPTTLTDRMKVDKNKNVLYIDGISKVTNSTSTFTCQYPLFICASPDGNISSPKYFGSMRIYSCQIYDNGKLVRDYVPAINSNGIAGLYDMTNNMFYPSDSSTNFVAGTKINNAFTKLEYIESNGNQYIDTEFKPNQNTRVISDFQMTSSSGSQFVYGARNSSYVQAFGFLISSTTNTFRALYGSANTNVNITFLNRYTCDQNKNICSVGGVTVDSGTEIFSSQYNMFLFSGNRAGTSEARGRLKMYSCKIYDNGLLVRDFIPVLRYDGSYGLYDKVNKRFYNSASGTPFTGA